MGRFEDALKKAAKERKKILKGQQDSHTDVDFVDPRLKVEPHLITQFHQKSFYTDQYQTLRINIERKLKHKKNISILFTSSSRGEGKTTTVINLAFTIESDLDTKKILLVDGDFRKPTIDNYLGLDNKEGLCDILLSKIPFEQSIIKQLTPKLDYLPSGSKPESPADLLHSKQLHPLFATLRNKYDWLLIDSPPILLFSDSMSFIDIIDGIVMIIHSGKTSKPIIQRSIETFPEDKIIGFLMNNVEYPIPNFIYKMLFGKIHSYDYYY
ncbi:CpsD/CapB family tyrosine-protein kinase [bacterium]|nr:CpsD/CapB family tyrosine-protein kinase [bacterium]